MKPKQLILLLLCLLTVGMLTTAAAAQQVQMVYHNDDVIHVLAITGAALKLDVEQVTYEYIPYEEFDYNHPSDIVVLLGMDSATILLPMDPTDEELAIADTIVEGMESRVTPTIIKVEEVDVNMVNDILADYEDSVKNKEDETNKEDSEDLPTPELIAEPEPICQGCLKDDTCYSEGARVENEYCDGSEFVTQKETSQSCQSNVECQTNLCIEGVCETTEAQKEPGFFAKFFGWFANIFS